MQKGKIVSEHKKIQWKETKLNQDAKTAPVVAVGMEIVHSFICVCLFVLSARIMLADVFPWADFTVGNILVIGVFSIIISAVMEGSYFVKGKIGYVLRWGLWAVGIFLGIGYWRVADHGEKILNGSQKILSLLVHEWNTYYGTSISVNSGNIEYVSIALNFWLVVICCFLLWEVKMLRKNMVFVLLPAVVLVGELMLGYVPKELGIFLLFAGILLANISGWKETGFGLQAGKRRRSLGTGFWITGGILAIFILLLCTTVKLTGTASAQKQVENPEALVEFQKGLEDWFLELSFWDLFAGNGDSLVEELNNEKPQYKSEPVLSFRTSQKPLGTIYLKGFYGDRYSDGKWKLDTKDFEEACKEAGFDSEQVSEELAFMGYEKLHQVNTRIELEDPSYSSYAPGEWGEDFLESLVYDESTENISIDASVTYLDSSGKKAFFPYFIEVEDENISVEGDWRLTKEKSLTEVSFSVWKFESAYQRKLIEFSSGSRRDWEDWYEEYVLEHYLEVPEGMDNVEEIADIIEATDYIGTDLGTVDTENEVRLAKAYRVANWMQYETNYSLELSDIPDGMDPIEYFLGNSRQGYCMHYASAAVMLLREMGVPARYASGYVVWNDGFTENENGYEVTIHDNNAHAWAEIYLNGIGWVPVEVTKGYQNSTTADNMEEVEPESETESQNLQSPENSQDTQETQESQIENSEENQSSQTPGTGNAGKEQGGSKLSSVLGKILLVVILAAVFLAAFLFLRAQQLRQTRLKNDLRRKKTRRAVRSINRKVYHRLLWKGRIFRVHLRDEEYESLLKKTYDKIAEDDWTHYMEIVKAAAFSSGNISVEDMQFCCEIYRKITQNY